MGIEKQYRLGVSRLLFSLLTLVINSHKPVIKRRVKHYLLERMRVRKSMTASSKDAHEQWEDIYTFMKPSENDTFMFGKLSGLPYMLKNNMLYCWYPGAKKWHISLNNVLATFITEPADYFSIREKFPDCINAELPL